MRRTDLATEYDAPSFRHIETPRRAEGEAGAAHLEGAGRGAPIYSAEEGLFLLETEDRTASALGVRLLVAILAIVSVVAAMAIEGLVEWSDRAHRTFRDEVTAVLARRFHRVATPVPGDSDAIEIGGRRRDLRSLFTVATREQEPERSEIIYRWFLGDTETVGRPIVRNEPVDAKDAADTEPPPFAVWLPPPKRVKTIRLGPDGSVPLHTGR